jgi:hypothetical protein
VVEEELDKQIKSADEYASKCKRISLCAAIKEEEDFNSILNVSKRKF